MLHGYFDLPTLVFFDSGNVWAGSMYTNFSYKIDYLTEEKKKTALRLRIWYGAQSIEYAEQFEYEKTFEFSDEGLAALIGELNSEFDKYRENH